MFKEEDDVASSVSTVKRRLREVGLNGRIARQKLHLLPRHKKMISMSKKLTETRLMKCERKLYGQMSQNLIFSTVMEGHVRRRQCEESGGECV